MKMREVLPHRDRILKITFDDGTVGQLDISKWLNYEAFADLADSAQFSQVHNGGYFVEWKSGADLSIDTILAHLKPMEN